MSCLQNDAQNPLNRYRAAFFIHGFFLKRINSIQTIKIHVTFGIETLQKGEQKSSSSFLNSKMCKMSGMKLKQQYYAFSAHHAQKNRLNINFFHAAVR